MAGYRYKGRGVVEANGYRWEGSTIAPDGAKVAGNVVDVTDEATLKKLRTHPSFEKLYD